MTAAADWSGRVGEVWAEEWPRTERAFAGLEPQLEAAILAVAPPGGRFLDIGCGVGTTSLAIAAARPGAHVTGVDLSPGMIDLARRRSVEMQNAGFVNADVLAALKSSPSSLGEEDCRTQPGGGGALEVGGPYDLLFSRHGVMFFADADAAFRRLHAAAAPGAPLVFSCFAAAADNPWATLITPVPARSTSYVPGPFAFADEGAGRDLLRTAGWRDPTARRVDFRYLAGQGEDPVADAVALFTRIGPAASALRDAAPADQPALRDRLVAAITPWRTANVVDFPAAAWLWTAHA